MLLQEIEFKNEKDKTAVGRMLTIFPKIFGAYNQEMRVVSRAFSFKKEQYTSKDNTAGKKISQLHSVTPLTKMDIDGEVQEQDLEVGVARYENKCLVKDNSQWGDITLKESKLVPPVEKKDPKKIKIAKSLNT